ncbi:MAG: SDR family NAD(P)-dependent oxidoreductase [Haloferacaceae archaeon]
MSALDDKTALVTGASHGIGRGIAEGLAAEGATVVVNYPPFDGQDEQAAAVVAGIEDGGGDAIAVEADVTREADVRAMVETTEERLGPLDVLVNNAGGSPPTSPLAEMDVDTWDQVLDLNLRGVFLTTRFALPGMVERADADDPGRIINVASQQGILGAKNRVHYCAAKGGVISFTRALARELAPSITVNAIAPGPIRTGKREDPEAWSAARGEELPMGRAGVVSDVAPTAVFLAKPDGGFYTGQTLSPDGGDAMH